MQLGPSTKSNSKQGHKCKRSLITVPIAVIGCVTYPNTHSKLALSTPVQLYSTFPSNLYEKLLS